MSFPLLTATAALPAIGAIATAAVPAARRTAAKWLALTVSLATLVLALHRVRPLRTGRRPLPADRIARLDQGLRRPLRTRRRRHRGGAPRAHRPADPVRDPGRLARRRRPGDELQPLAPHPGLLRPDPHGGSDGDPLLRGHRRLPLLHPLRSHAHPDVLPHRGLRGPGALGQRRERGGAAQLRRGEVPPLQPGRMGSSCWPPSSGSTSSRGASRSRRSPRRGPTARWTWRPPPSGGSSSGSSSPSR